MTVLLIPSLHANRNKRNSFRRVRPTAQAEADLHRGLVGRLKEFPIELGRDFCFVGSHYPAGPSTGKETIQALAAAATGP